MALTAYKVWQYVTERTGYDVFQADVKENGYICGGCRERFHVYSPRVVCHECIEKAIMNFRLYQKHLWNHDESFNQCGATSEEKMVAILALFNEDREVIRIGATTNVYSWVDVAEKKYEFESVAILAVGPNKVARGQAKELIQLLSPATNGKVKNKTVSEDTEGLYTLMQRDLDRFLSKGLTPAGVKRVLLGAIPAAVRQWVLDEFDYSCIMPGCDKEINKNNPLTIDHILPVSRGGTHDTDNLQLLCRSHNSSKSNKTSVDYRPQWWRDHPERQGTLHATA